MIIAPPSLSKQDILASTSDGLDFYHFVIPGLQVNGHKCNPVSNPFYTDTKPSLSIFYADGQWLFNDFGDPAYKGDVFTFAGHYYNLDSDTRFPEILAKIKQDLSLSILDNFSQEPYEVTTHHIIAGSGNGDLNTLKFRASIKLRTHFKDFELKYWGKFGVNEELLSRYNVSPVEALLPASGLHLASCPNNPVFAYTTESNSYKIYQPHNSRYKFQWISSRPQNWYFGYKQLPSTGKFVVITGGEKDVISLSALGLAAITLNSETSILPETLYHDLSSRFENIIIFYDSDETGVKQSEILCRKYGLIQWNLPPWLKEKGGKDISDYIAMGGDIDNDDITIEHFQRDESTIKSVDLTLPDLEKFSHVARITQVRSANQRLAIAASMPPIQKLLGIFFHSGELAILFADTGVGKSVFSVAAADAIARGSDFMILQNEATPQIVLYYDFELSDKQFHKRYSDDNGFLYTFSQNLFLVNLSYDDLMNLNTGMEFDEILYRNIERDIIEKNATVIIIDNLTFLKTQPMQEQDTALAIMKKLILLKRQYNLSMLVLAHTPKIINTTPLNINHLQGAKHISNFSDSVFCLGHSAIDPSLRYLKQVKPSRSAELVYDSDNIILCELRKENNFLTFFFRNYDSENNHLIRKEDANKELKSRAHELRSEGKTIVQIAEILQRGKSTIDRWLKS